MDLLKFEDKYGKELKGMDKFWGEATLLKWFLSFLKRVYSKRKEFAPLDEYPQ